MTPRTIEWFVFTVVLWMLTFTGLLNGRLEVWSTPLAFGMGNRVECALDFGANDHDSRCYGIVTEWRGL